MKHADVDEIRLLFVFQDGQMLLMFLQGRLYSKTDFTSYLFLNKVPNVLVPDNLMPIACVVAYGKFSVFLIKMVSSQENFNSFYLVLMLRYRKIDHSGWLKRFIFLDVTSDLCIFNQVLSHG